MGENRSWGGRFRDTGDMRHMSSLERDGNGHGSVWREQNPELGGLGLAKSPSVWVKGMEDETNRKNLIRLLTEKKISIG